ncbi:MAG: tetratricopeptide repeat protein [bacterium]|nr:tetratricopeptide repeat protein [bacterium]
MKPAFLAAAILVSALAGAAAQESPVPPVPDVDLFALNPEMVRFLDARITPTQDRRTRLHSLMDAVFGAEGLGITYEKAGTKTAVETFESRSGNCLAFTILLVAMARHVDLDAHFHEVAEVMSWDRRGEIILRNQHMFVEVEIGGDRMRVDFLPEAEKRYRRVSRINDERALAHYFNNIGVETLATGDIPRSLAYFHKALEADESFSPAWTNIGVAYRRRGDLERAEQSHLKAIAIDKAQVTAIANLASLYSASGRHDEAEPLLRKVERYLKRNPFHQFDLGVQSARVGDTSRAIGHLKKAIRILPGEADFHVTLAEIYLRVGKVRKARASLKRGLALSGSERERERLQKELEALEGQQ